jgi:IS4 transposase
MVAAGIRGEFEGVKLGDPRREKRVKEIAEALAARPDASLPVAMGSTAKREGAYRCLSNRRVTVARVMVPHVEATVERARSAGKVLVVSDTTEFKFSTEREGLGHLSSKRREGFLGHLTLAVSADGRRTPLGVLGLETMVRTRLKGQRDNAARKKDPERESLRWLRSAEAASRLLDGVEAIHVMDREADIYELLSGLTSNGRRFIIRSGQDRVLEDGRLSTVVESAAMQFTREVNLSARAKAQAPANRRTHPARRTRLARLSISTMQVTLRKPHTASDPGLPPSVTVNLVRVWETECPPGEPPVEWRLFTTEPVDTQQQVEDIVDNYRARWLIEEYFKALKTGCNFERSQLESLHSLENLLGVYIPIAWQILALRSCARDQPERPATEILSRMQIAALRLIVRGKALPPEPTVGDVATAIADLGAHIKSNGPPGWQVLARGFDELRRAEHIYRQMISATSCDQS